MTTNQPQDLPIHSPFFLFEYSLMFFLLLFLNVLSHTKKNQSNFHPLENNRYSLFPIHMIQVSWREMTIFYKMHLCIYVYFDILL